MLFMNVNANLSELKRDPSKQVHIKNYYGWRFTLDESNFKNAYLASQKLFYPELHAN